jgi:hypothetical protein
MAAIEDTSVVQDAATLGRRRTDHFYRVKSLFCSKMIISKPKTFMQHARRLPSLAKGAGLLKTRAFITTITFPEIRELLWIQERGILLQ